MGIVLTVVGIALLSLYWVGLQPTRRRIWLLAVVGSLFFSLGYVVYESPQFSRLVPMADYFQGQTVEDTSILTRDQMRKDGINLWLERPFAGWGVDQYRVVSGWRTYAHDNYAELLTNGGVFGLLLYLMIYLSLMVPLVRTLLLSKGPRPEAAAFWGVTVVVIMLAADFSIVSYYNKFHWVMASLVTAVVWRSRAPRAESVDVRMPTPPPRQVREKPIQGSDSVLKPTHDSRLKRMLRCP